MIDIRPFAVEDFFSDAMLERMASLTTRTELEAIKLLLTGLAEGKLHMEHSETLRA